MPSLLIYGANGYTGRLIAAEAKRRGIEAIIAGRRESELAALAGELNLPHRSFTLDSVDDVSRQLTGVTAVLHCAGPFSQTAAPMLTACLAARAHYLDITGEIEVFAHCHRHHAQAVDAGITVLPGTGFDVVPTDCLAAMLKRRLPDAVRLVLAFEAGGGASPGTAKTSVEGLAGGGRARIDGEIRRVPLAWKSRSFQRNGQARSAMTIPWGDVYTVYVSTGIANVETYMAVPPATIRRLRRLRWITPLLRLGVVQRLLQRRAARVPGPDAQRRARTGCHVWGEVENADGARRRLELATPNGYELTVSASLGIAERVLAGGATPGFHTPSTLMGADYVLGLPGVRLIDPDADTAGA
jgi:short subunit dehydrogenase-like uncharacterized protein